MFLLVLFLSCTGVLLISLALCADAIIGNLQEKTLKQYSGSNLEMILYSYSIGERDSLFQLQMYTYVRERKDDS